MRITFWWKILMWRQHTAVRQSRPTFVFLIPPLWTASSGWNHHGGWARNIALCAWYVLVICWIRKYSIMVGLILPSVNIAITTTGCVECVVFRLLMQALEVNAITRVVVITSCRKSWSIKSVLLKTLWLLCANVRIHVACTCMLLVGWMFLWA